MNLNDLRDKAYKTACDKGFHDVELSNEHFLMLVITELSEAVEADRKGKRSDVKVFNTWMESPNTFEHVFVNAFEHAIKDSVGDELADAAIRLLDLAGLISVDVELDDIFIEELSLIDDETFTEAIYCIVRCVHYCNRNPVIQPLEGIFGLAMKLDINLKWNIEQKMKYNETRGYRHGKKY